MGQQSYFKAAKVVNLLIQNNFRQKKAIK